APASADRDELSDRTLIGRLLGQRHGPDDLDRGRHEERERDEGEEPRDGEVEPVGEDELEAYEERTRERRELHDVPRSRHEAEGDGRDEEEALEHGLDGPE